MLATFPTRAGVVSASASLASPSAKSLSLTMRRSKTLAPLPIRLLLVFRIHLTSHCARSNEPDRSSPRRLHAGLLDEEGQLEGLVLDDPPDRAAAGVPGLGVVEEENRP